MLFKLIKVSTNFDLPVFQFLDKSNYSKKLSKNVKEKAIYLHRDTCLMLGHGLGKKFVLFLMMITKKLAFSGAGPPFVSVSSSLDQKNFHCLTLLTDTPSSPPTHTHTQIFHSQFHNSFSHNSFTLLTTSWHSTMFFRQVNLWNKVSLTPGSIRLQKTKWEREQELITVSSRGLIICTA